MSSPQRKAPYCVTVFCLAFCCCMAFAVQGTADTSEFEEIWFGTPSGGEGQKLSFVLHLPEAVPISEPVQFDLEIMTAVPYQDTRILLLVEDLDENPISESSMNLELRRGRNDVSIQWDPAQLAPGLYTLLVVVDYAQGFRPASYVVPIQRVSAAHWRAEIERLQGLLPQLEKSITSLASGPQGGEPGASDSGVTGHAPYLQVRKKIVWEALETARNALIQQLWRLVDRNLAYAIQGLDAIRAEITFSNAVPESMIPHNAYPISVEIRNGGLYERDNPLFLIGAALQPENDAVTGATGDYRDETGSMAFLQSLPVSRQVEWIKNHGLNFAVLTCPLNVESSSARARLAAFADAADQFKMPWVLQIDQAGVEGPMMDAWPELLEPGFANMAHADFSAVYKRIAADTVSIAGIQHYLPIGVSVARDPRFFYDGESIRGEFVERIKERYPDRIDLNRLWRAHLADFNEITIWGEHPEHAYQNQRAYQYEWQTFHRGLITLFFSGLKQELAQAAPNVPVMLTLPESAFSSGETRNTPSREDMSHLMDMNGAQAVFEPGETLYAMNYPLPHAYITLMRSYSPGKPVLLLDTMINISKLKTVRAREAMVRSAVWEAVMSGATGIALSSDSSVYNFPEAVAAYAHAAMEVNRLAPIVMAFQQAPAEIAILFSESSKIMDGGVPHLESARFAFEGSSFSGFPVRFMTEKQIESGGLENVKVLVLPNTMAVPDGTFTELSKYVEEGRMVARVGTPIPYNERGHSRSDVIRATGNTVLVRGMNLPTEYLHAMDAALVGGVLPEIARPINAHGYPVEGVRSLNIQHEGQSYLYIINLRRTPVVVHLSGLASSGRDLIQGREISFPRELQPLDPMLIHLDKKELVFTASN